MKLEEFKGKSVVVTGAGAGMGKAITQGFLESGATVIGVDIKEEALSAFKDKLKENNVEISERFIPLTGDISKEATNEAKSNINRKTGIFKSNRKCQRQSCFKYDRESRGRRKVKTRGNDC